MGIGIKQNSITMEIEVYYKDSNGYIEDNRPKSCEGKVVKIEGKKYKLTEV